MRNKYFIGYYNPANLVTISGAACAILGCFLTAQGNLVLATCALLVAALCDAVDGRIARATASSSKRVRYFGVQIDSLCDVVSFGVAPCFMAYLMGYNQVFDILLYLMFIVCGAMRLANFNTEAALDTKDMKMHHFTGIPIPFSATIFPLLAIVHLLAGGPVFWLFRLVYFCIGIGYILRIRIPKPTGKTQALIGVYCVISLIALIIIANVK